jgi:hypothetical protein
MTPALALHLPRLITAIAQVFAPLANPRRMSDLMRTLRVTEGRFGPRAENPSGDLLDPDRHHGQRAAVRMWASGRYRVMVVICVPQDGKDTGINAPIFLHTIAERRRPIVYATTDMRLTGKMVRAKLLPMIKASGLSWLLPVDGLGSGSGTPDEVLWATGVRSYFLGAGASNGGGQAGVTAWAVIVNEADKIRSAQREWLQERNLSYQEERQTLLIGSLDDDGPLGMQATYDQSSLGRMHMPCRACGTWWAPEPEHITYDASTPDVARATARLVCQVPTCKHEHTEDDRQWMLTHSQEVHAGERIDGKGPGAPVVGDRVPTEIGGLKLWAMDSPLRNMGEYVARDRSTLEHLARTGDDSKRREFVHSEQARQYTNVARTLGLREMDLALRSAQAVLALRDAPADADLLCVGIDQQLRRLIPVTVAYRIRDESWWIIDHDSVPICGETETPTDPQVFAAFDRIAATVMGGYARPNGTIIRPIAAGIDVSDGQTKTRALLWMKARPGWYPLVGAADSQIGRSDALGTALLRLPGVCTVYRQTATVPYLEQFRMEVDQLKGDVMRGLSRKPVDPGAGHIPHGESAQGWLIKELCAERLEDSDAGPVFVQTYRHNHRLDGTGYGIGLCKYFAHLRIIQSGATDAADYVNRMTQGNT